MSTTIYNYKLYCQTEDTWVTQWGSTSPSVCPHDPAHTIIPESINIIQTLSQDLITIQDGTPGYFQTSTIVLDVPAGNSGDVFIHNKSYPFEMQLWKTNYIPVEASVNDVLNVIVGPDTPISYLTATGNIGDILLHLHPAIFSAGVIVKGCYLNITNGVDTVQDLGRTIAIDAINYTVTIENALTSVFNIGSGILLNLYLARDFIIPYAGINFQFGNKGFNTKKIPANTIIRFKYVNNNGLAKKVLFCLEYNYS